MSSANASREVNINVVVRARPMNSRELAQSAKSAVRINHSTNIIEVTQQSRQQTKSYLFDRVFSEQTTQELFYKQVVSPVVRDFVEGFNCTLFAYGQTGTGKTYTMVGDQTHLISDKRQKYLDFSVIPDAGVIPRVSDEIFKILDSQNADYQVRVSHMEVYCEEIYDLLKDSSGDREALKLFEEKPSYGMGIRGHRPDDARDTTGFLPSSLPQSGDRTGGKLVILGLEEALVKSPTEIMSLLLRSMENRRVAETKMNSNSSRSHSIFTICLIVKETAPSSNTNVDVDVIRISKLNLVDLAGSESAGKSGASGDRQQEASKINKSLLTLGRVINALTETKQHIPYRESKLTRLLQDSLGGRTKTCIIATITTSDAALDETINTLDYMSRAKKIKNLPEMTTKISGKSVLKEYSLEIKRLRELLTIQKDAQGGIFLSVESYDEMTEAARNNKAQITELEARIQHATKEMERFMVLFSAEEKKVDKLKAALNKTVTKVNELHNEKINLYEKIVRGRDREKSNMAAYAAFKDQGGSSLLEQVFNADNLRRTIDQSGIMSAIVEVEKTVSACKTELLLFSEALTQTLADHRRDMTTGFEGLMKKLMVPIIQSSSEMLGSTIPTLLEKDLLGKLVTEFKNQFFKQTGADLSSMIVDPCTKFVNSMEKRMSTLLESFNRLSGLLNNSSEAMHCLFREILLQFQEFTGKETAFISSLNSFLVTGLDQQSLTLTDHLKGLLEQACKEILNNFTSKLEFITGDLKSQLDNKCSTHVETLTADTNKFVDVVKTKELPSLVSGYSDLKKQLQDIHSDVNNALDLLKTHQKHATTMPTKYMTCLERAFNNDIIGAIETPINKSSKQLMQIGETLMDMKDAFSTQMSSISDTSHTTLLDAVTNLSQTHIHGNIVGKLLSGASLDPTVKDSSTMASILSSDLEKECLDPDRDPANAEFSMVTNITMCSIADMVSRFETSVASAFATLMSGFHLTPVIPAGTSTLETPAIGTPNVRPIALAQTHADFVYGVVTPSIPLNKSALTQDSVSTGTAETQDSGHSQ